MSKEILKKIQSGEMKYFVWEEIHEINGSYFVPIDPKFVKKGILQTNRLYQILFTFAERACPLLEVDSTH